MRRSARHSASADRSRRPHRRWWTAPWLHGRNIARTLGIGAVGTWVVAFVASPAMTVRSMSVQVYGAAEPHEIRAIVRSSAIPRHTRLLQVRAGDLERRLAQWPWVASARVHRDVWTRSIRLSVTVREPTVALECSGRRWELDDEGHVIRPLRRGQKLTEVIADVPVKIVQGQQISSEEILGGLAAARLSRAVPCLRGARINVDQSAAICFNSIDGVEIRAGDAGNLPTKLAVVQRVYDLAEREHYRVRDRLVAIDVSVPRHPGGLPVPREDRFAARRM